MTIRPASPTGFALLLFAFSMQAQSPSPSQEIRNILPADAKVDQIVLVDPGKRTFYTSQTGEVWVYNQIARTAERVMSTKVWDVTVSAKQDLIAYTKAGEDRAEHYVWVMPLDPATGTSKGPERRLTSSVADVPSISPDSRLIAFGRDDSTGVGQSLVVIPAAGGAERVLVPSMPSSLANIRWTPDGSTLYFGVNMPVNCVPEWSCLPLPSQRRAGSIRRVALSGGSSTQIAAARGLYPGLSPDGSLIMYIDTTAVRRWVIADVSGALRDTLSLPLSHSVQGWIGGSAALVRASGASRTVRSMSLSDGQERVLMKNAEASTDPAWSPDGKRFSVIVRGGRAQLRTMRTDGALEKTVTLSDVSGSNSTWSPDGRWIAYIGFAVNEPPRLQLVDVAQGTATKLTNLPESAFQHAIRWLPDSRGVVLSERGEPDTVTFTKVSITGQVTPLRRVAIAPIPSSGFALDSASAIVITSSPRTYRRVSLIDNDTGTVLLPPIPGFTSVPVVSPDAAWVTVRANAASESTNHQQSNTIHLFRADGSSRSRVQLPFFAAPTAVNPYVLPGGTEMIAVENRGPSAAVYLVNTSTSAVRRLFPYAAQFGFPEIAVSPTSRSIVYVISEAIPLTFFAVDLSPRGRK